MIELIDILKDLIAIDSTNPPGNCMEITEYIADFLKNRTEAHVEFQEISNKNKNVLAVYGEPRIFINAHLDTVPHSLHHDKESHALHEKDTKLFGRGTTDVKGGISAILYSLQQFQPKNLLFIFNPDEEYGNNNGIKVFLNSNRAEGLKGGIVTEPTQCQVVMFHNGICTIQVDFEGKAAHACTPDKGINAIEMASEFIQKLIIYKESLSQKIFLGLKPTINIATINGGIKPNMVPDTCTLILSCRYLPDENPDQVVHEINKLTNNRAVSIKLLYTAPPLNCGIKDTFFIEKLRSCGVENNIKTARFWSEAALFSQAGIPSVVFGPGDIEQAHSNEEFIYKNQLLRSAEIYKKLFSQL